MCRTEKLLESELRRCLFPLSKTGLQVVGEYDPDMCLAEDWDYWLRVYRHFSMVHLSATPYQYRHHPESLSAKRYHETCTQSARLLCRHVASPEST